MLRLTRKIATTKMSEVWEGFLDGQHVAVKKPVDDEMLKLIRFVKEAKYWKEVSDLEIDGVAKVVGIDEDEPWFAVEFIEGETLDKNLRNANIREIMSRMLEVLRILSVVHKHGYLHLDIKPSNILIDKYGDVVFLDWGLAARIFRKLKDEKYTFIGTPSYAPPEMWDPDKYGTPDQRSDVYEVGTTFYRVIAKQVPFHKKSEVLSGKIRPFPKHVPEWVKKVILKAIAPDMSKRYQSAMEMYRDVQKWLKKEKVLWRGIYNVRFRKSLLITANHGFNFVADQPKQRKAGKVRVPIPFPVDSIGKIKIAEIEGKKIKAYREGVSLYYGLKKTLKPNETAELYHGMKILYKKEDVGKLDYGYRNVVYVDFISADVEVARKYFEFLNYLREKKIKYRIKRGDGIINMVAHKVLIRGEKPDERIDTVVNINDRRIHFRLSPELPLDSDLQVYDPIRRNADILKDAMRCEI